MLGDTAVTDEGLRLSVPKRDRFYAIVPDGRKSLLATPGLGVTSHINARGDSIAQAAQMPHNRPEQDQMPRLRRISSMSFRSSSTGAAAFALVFGRAVVFAGSRDGENFGSGDAVTTQDIRDVR
jgi:hypothetical protein